MSRPLPPGNDDAPSLEQVVVRLLHLDFLVDELAFADAFATKRSIRRERLLVGVDAVE